MKYTAMQFQYQIFMGTLQLTDMSQEKTTAF